MPANRVSPIFALLTSLILLVFTSHTLADISDMTWILDQSNTFADGVSYGSVNILADTDDGSVQFTVDAFDVQPTYGQLTNFGIQAFGFNFSDGVDGPAHWTSDLPAGWSEFYDKNLSEFGEFLVKEQGTGGTRQDELVFTLTLDNHDQAVADFFAVSSTGGEEVFFAAHVAGFDSGIPQPDNPDENIGSHWIGGGQVVPLPGAALLGVIGLGMIGWLKRRLA